MMSGSAALPVKTLERWREISGHTLLERYGMTEIGMALGESADGRAAAGLCRHAAARRRSPAGRRDGREVEPGTPGELEVRGPSVFLEYWRRPEETAAAFRDGWFRTGDVAVVEGGSYRLLGRTSVDIIKTGGFKVSALEIEEVLRTHPAIAECAVVGVSDEDWGECVSAAVELRHGRDPLARRPPAVGQAAARAVQDPARAPAGLGSAAECDGESRQTGSCRPVQIAITSSNGSPYAVARRSACGDARCCRRGAGPALLPRRQLCRPLGARPDAGCLVCHLSPRVSLRPHGVFRHRLADRLSLRRDQPDDAAVRADQDTRQP